MIKMANTPVREGASREQAVVPSAEAAEAAEEDSSARRRDSQASRCPARDGCQPAHAEGAWLAVCFPMLGLEVHFLEALGAAEAVDDAPTVLVDEGRVAQVDAGARQAGIRIGTTLATAHSIAPGLRHFQRDRNAEHKRLEWLGLVAYRFSSRVSLEPPDALHVEARGSLRLFGGLRALVTEINARYRRLGHATRIAAAATPLAALALARAGFDEPRPAPHSTSSPHPSPVFPSLPLRQVPLAGIGLPPQEVERLTNMGIRRLGELLDLPTRELGQRFPSTLVDYLHRLTGRKADPRRPIALPERFRFSAHLLEGVHSKDALLPPMRRVIARVATKLAARGLGARRLAWTFTALSGATAAVQVGLAEASADAAAFLRLSQLRLERVALPREVMSVLLHAELVTPLLPPEADLLGDLPGMRGDGSATAKKRAELADLLAARLGDDAIRTLATVDDHRPEAAWAATPVVYRTLRPAGKPADAAAKPGARPLWLLDPPQPVSVRRFALRDTLERIETGWWDAAQARDYHVAKTKSHARCWLYRDHRGRWFLHGYFA